MTTQQMIRRQRQTEVGELDKVKDAAAANEEKGCRKRFSKGTPDCSHHCWHAVSGERTGVGVIGKQSSNSG